jgi:PAS domain S-box-containing protein
MPKKKEPDEQKKAKVKAAEKKTATRTPSAKPAMHIKKKTQSHPKDASLSERETLRRSEERLSRAQAIAHIGDWEWDLATNAVHWSEELFHIYGFDPNSVAPDYALVLAQMHPESKDVFLKAIDAALNEDRHFELDYRFFRKDGSEAMLHTIGQVVRDASGAPMRMLGIVQDITERIDSERRLRESEDKFRSIFEQANDGIMIGDAETKKHVEANKAICRMLGYSREELVGLSVDDIHPKQDLSTIRDLFEKQLRGEIELIPDAPMLRKDGSVFYADINAAPVTLGGKPCLAGVFRDITERKQADAALRQREKQLAESQRIGRIGSWEHNLTTGEVVWSDELFRLLGLDPRKDPPDFKLFFEAIHPDDRPALKKAIDETVKTGKHFSIDYRLILKDGTTRILHAQAELRRDESGEQAILSGTGQDITERKRAEDALRESERRYHTLFDQSPDGVVLIDTEGKLLDFNDQAHLQLGYTREEFEQLRLSDIDPVESPEEIQDSISRVLETGKAVFDVKHRTKQGEIRDVNIITQVVTLSGKQVMYAIWHDITERKQAEEKLSEKNTMLLTLINAIPDQVFFKDSEGRYVLVNKAMEETLGLGQEAFVGITDDELSPPDVAEKCKRSDAEAMQRGAPVYSDECYTDKNGETKFLDVVKAPIYDTKGDPKGLVVVSRDITERKQAEEKIRQNEEFIRGILDTVDEGFIVIDRDFRILTANKAYCGQVGRVCDDIIGKHCFEISHKTFRPCYEEGEECAVREVFATGKPHSVLHRHNDNEGNVLYVETKGFPIKDASGDVVSVIETINNITERHLLEEERLKTQKLESIGTLAGGIAHDFNNLLQGVFGYISMAKMTFDQPEKSRAMLDQAEKALHQSVNLTTQLLTFSKGGKPIKKPIDLAPVIENAVKFALSGSRTEYRLFVDPGLWQVNGDAGQLSQVIQNIVLNADQAMPLGGVVNITARNRTAGEASLPSTLHGGDYLAVTIEDNGVGIPQQYRDRIFDPYFTTKEKGSGLGLATSYSIMRNHDGQIQVDSEGGKGTVFTLYVPALPDRSEAEAARHAAPPAVKTRILVMDDEEMIRDLVTELLRTLGHEVEVAAHGEEAVARYQAAAAAGRPFGIVILDLTVRGGLGGAETVQRLRAIDPQVKAVVSSGYSENAVIADHLEHGFKAFLKKPYDVDELKKILNSLLSQ